MGQKTVNIYVEIYCKDCKKKSEHAGSAPFHLVNCSHCGSGNFSFYGEQTETTPLTKFAVYLKKKPEYLLNSLPVMRHAFIDIMID